MAAQLKMTRRWSNWREPKMSNNDNALRRRSILFSAILCFTACDDSSVISANTANGEKETSAPSLKREAVTVPFDSAKSTSPESENAIGAAEILPIYVNDDGVGILRYSRPDGSARELWLAAGGMTNNPERPFETVSGDAGPFAGPHIAIYLPGGKMHLPLDQIAFALYERDPYKHIAYLRPVIAPMKAETMEACGEINRLYECSKKIDSKQR